MANGIYRITEEFEEALSKYTGAPYVVTVDNASNALFLSLYYENIKGKTIVIPNRTYPSVPCEIIHAGGKVKFRMIEGEFLKVMISIYFLLIHSSAFLKMASNIFLSLK